MYDSRPCTIRLKRRKSTFKVSTCIITFCTHVTFHLTPAYSTPTHTWHIMVVCSSRKHVKTTQQIADGNFSITFVFIYQIRNLNLHVSGSSRLRKVQVLILIVWLQMYMVNIVKWNKGEDVKAQQTLPTLL